MTAPIRVIAAAWYPGSATRTASPVLGVGRPGLDAWQRYALIVVDEGVASNAGPPCGTRGAEGPARGDARPRSVAACPALGNVPASGSPGRNRRWDAIAHRSRQSCSPEPSLALAPAPHGAGRT